ncbi:SigB/SigF/SigG family RNA polymerase sigma factor [Amycolatopsis kentuckyensis]|uniref:SigB/SigF/SigG family RNA polymerase sigma factor n=1 Tax=Amycolatopsis kentuckyensis TaxID=218823 RepID=UPI00356AC1E7
MVVRAPERPAATLTPAPRRANQFAHCAPLFDERSELTPGDPRQAELRARLITEHLALAENIAKRFAGRGESFDDLVQVARTGLIHAVDRYDPGRGRDFLSFAVPTIMGEVRRHFRDSAWSMRVPRALKELQQNLVKATGELAHDLGRSPTPSELAAHLDIDVETVREGLLAAEAYKPASLDAPVRGGGDTGTIGDQLADRESPYTKADDHLTLEAAMADLPPRERAIIEMRFVEELTQSQIAERVGVSQMQVSRLLAKTLEQLRHRVVAG